MFIRFSVFHFSIFDDPLLLEYIHNIYNSLYANYLVNDTTCLNVLKMLQLYF